jgi:hypothetical protein
VRAPHVAVCLRVAVGAQQPSGTALRAVYACMLASKLGERAGLLRPRMRAREQQSAPSNRAAPPPALHRALHTRTRADSKAKARAVDVGVAYPLARVLAARLDEANTLAVRARMLISDLLRIQDMQVGAPRVLALFCVLCSAGCPMV